jgi:heterotetrameric sarcosine oxidase gamma subunit
MLSRVTKLGALIRVQSWERHGAIVPAVIAELMQLQWPARTGTVATGNVEVICINPADWLIVAGEGVSADELLVALRRGFHGGSLRATDLSHALGRICIEGADARPLLSKTCALDVGSSFELIPGRAPRTLVAGIPTIIRCLAPTSFELIVALSYVEWLMAWLGDAAA